MNEITFCNRCRGMKVGWNRKYVGHCLVCRSWIYRSLRAGVLAGLIWCLIFIFPVSTGNLAPDLSMIVAEAAPVDAAVTPVASVAPAAVSVIDGMLARHQRDAELRARLARSIVASSRNYNVDPRLVASIAIVESGGNPFAISSAGAVGIMQVHIPTWSDVIEQHEINPFKVEDNIELGARILRGYIARHGLWEGVARYYGWTDAPGSFEAAEEYVRKVQRVYGYDASQTAVQ